jgi:hypothetical protein
MIRRVPGVEFDGSTISITIGRLVFEAEKVDYSDDITTTVGTSLGTQEQRYRTLGVYKTGQVTIEPRFSVLRRDFLSSLAPNGFGGQINPIIVGYWHPQLGKDSDLLAGARLVSITGGGEVGGKQLMMPIKFDIMQIFWGNGRQTLNRVEGFPQLGT